MTAESRRERMARKIGPHAEVSRRQEIVPAAHGIAQHMRVMVTTACGREVPSTLTTRTADRVRCPDCQTVTSTGSEATS